MSEVKLSKRAAALYERVKAGRFYMAYDAKLPAAMKELEQAGLVRIAARPVTIAAAYVPTTGYTPYTREKFGDEG